VSERRRAKMADNEKPLYPSILVSDAGAPEGSCYVTDQRSGTTVVAEATPNGYLDAVRDLNRRS
jgi:hypothetical protein